MNGSYAPNSPSWPAINIIHRELNSFLVNSLIYCFMCISILSVGNNRCRSVHFPSSSSSSSTSSSSSSSSSSFPAVLTKRVRPKTTKRQARRSEQRHHSKHFIIIHHYCLSFILFSFSSSSLSLIPPLLIQFGINHFSFRQDQILPDSIPMNRCMDETD